MGVFDKHEGHDPKREEAALAGKPKAEQPKADDKPSSSTSATKKADESK